MLLLVRIYRTCFWLGLAGLSILPSVSVSAQSIDPTHPPQGATVPTLNPDRIAQTPLPPAEQLPRDQLPPSQQPLPEPEVPSPLPPPSELLDPQPEPSTPSEEAPEDVPATIVVERFNVTGSTVFSQAQFDQVTEPFTQRPITLAELFQARTAVTNLYLERGYITSGAYIPPQTLRDGEVEIRVVEGQVEEIRVTGTRRLRPGYIRSRIALATGQPLNRDRLLEALQLLQLDPLIGSLSAELSAGTRPGVSLLDVRVTEADSFSVEALLDNGRSPSVGTDRRQIQVNELNLLGFGDRINAAYTNTDGSNAFDLSYTIPVSPRNATVSFNFSTAESKVIEDPFDVLNIESDSRTYELTFRQPIARSPNQEIALGLTATRRESDVTLDPFSTGRIPFPSPGSDDGETRITALRFFQEWVKRNTREVIAVRSQFSLGLDLFGSTINDNPPDSEFFAWRGQAQWVRLLARDTLLLLRADMQLADQTLVPLEQFGLGGIESVRGYRQDALLTDSGIFLSAEARIPVLRIPQWDGLLQLTPFIEFGTGWNRDDRPDPDPESIASIGLGLRFQVSDRLTARLDWGIPLVDVESSDNTLQEDGIYFSIIYRPF